MPMRTLLPSNRTIVNVMSTAALTGKKGESVYCAAKWGARGYTLALQAEIPQRVLAVYPGGMNTAFWPEERANFMDPKEIAARIVAAVFETDLTELILKRV